MSMDELGVTLRPFVPEDAFQMTELQRRDLAQPLPDVAEPAGVEVRVWRLESEGEQRYDLLRSQPGERPGPRGYDRVRVCPSGMAPSGRRPVSERTRHSLCYPGGTGVESRRALALRRCGLRSAARGNLVGSMGS